MRHSNEITAPSGSKGVARPCGSALAPVETPDSGTSGTHCETLLFVTRTESYGGTEKHLLQSLVRLRDDGRSRFVIACASADPYSSRIGEAQDVEVISFGLPKTLGQWFRLFRKIAPDIVVFEHGWLFCFEWKAYLAAKLAGARRICAIQHLIPPKVIARPDGKSPRAWLRRTFGWRARHVLPQRLEGWLADQTVCVTGAIQKFLIEHYDYPHRKLITIYNGVDATEFAPSERERRAVRARLGLSPDEVVLVATSRLSREKAPDLLIRALAEVIRRGDACKCVMVGDGPLREDIQRLILELGLSSHVILEGFQPDVRPYLQAADIFLLTSVLEGLPLALLEAMACGLPCVVTNVGGNAEAISSGQHGFVVEPGSADGVAEAISHLIRHPEERARMGALSREKAEQVFDIDACLNANKTAILGGKIDQPKDRQTASAAHTRREISRGVPGD